MINGKWSRQRKGSERGRSSVLPKVRGEERRESHKLNAGARTLFFLRGFPFLFFLLVGQ